MASSGNLTVGELTRKLSQFPENALVKYATAANVAVPGNHVAINNVAHGTDGVVVVVYGTL